MAEAAGPALGLVEVSSIAAGMVCCDALAKKAPVEIVVSRPVSPGKFVILFMAGVAEVEEAMAAALERAGDTLLDSLLLPAAHEQLAEVLRGGPRAAVSESLCIVETHTVAASVLTADAGLKAADVSLVEMRLAVGLGGKGYHLLCGVLDDVEAAAEAGRGAVKESLLARVEIIARPHPEFLATLRGAGPM